jgi:exodeoxyribonuclease-5
MPLTPHQQEVQDSALSIIKSGNRLLIKGSAGVGKTYLMNSFIEEARKYLSPYKTIYCSAPTNKAVAVLKSKVTNTDNVEFITLHSALKYKRIVDRKTGEVSFGPVFSERNKPLKGVSMIVVDEASMVGHDLHRDLEHFANLMGVKVVFVGDHKQLNPVQEEISPVFMGTSKTYTQEEYQEKGIVPGPDEILIEKEGSITVSTPYPTVELTEIIRQGDGNPIIDLSRNLKRIWTYEDNLVSNEPKVGYMHSRDKERVISTLAAINGSDELKYLGYTNQDVDALNTAVRKRIYGNPRKVEPGESIIFNSPYKDLYYTNQELKIEELTVVEQLFYLPYQDRSDKVKLKVYVINGKEMEGGWNGVFVVHEEHEKQFRTLAMVTKRACEARNMTWVDRDAFLSQFADIKYNHAITVHKSQGSTYKQVILNISNLSINRDEIEKQRLFYTGVTRASELLILFNN